MVPVTVGVAVGLAVLVDAIGVCVDVETLVEVAFIVGVRSTEEFSLLESGEALTATCVSTFLPLHADNKKIPARLKQSNKRKGLCILWTR